MSFDRLSRREFWLVCLALAVLFATLLLATGMAAGVLGVRFGVVPGPTLNITFGNFAVVAQTNNAPDCNPRQAGCPARDSGAGALPEYYSVWVVTTQRVAGPGSSQEQYGGARVFAIQAGP